MNTGARATYDSEADALAVRFPTAGSRYAESEEVAPGVILDLDTEGRVIGVQILDLRDLLASGERSGAVREPAA